MCIVGLFVFLSLGLSGVSTDDPQVSAAAAGIRRMGSGSATAGEMDGTLSWFHRVIHQRELVTDLPQTMRRTTMEDSDGPVGGVGPTSHPAGLKIYIYDIPRYKNFSTYKYASDAEDIR
jgi:hypothetical protein